MRARMIHRIGACFAVAILLAPPGCRKEEPTAAEPAKDTAEAVKDLAASPVAAVEAKVAEADKEAVEVKLAAADLVDGKTDKIVTKCPSCALGMDGKSEHTLEVLGYKLYFCSEPCKTAFAKDLTKSILDLKIPEG